MEVFLLLPLVLIFAGVFILWQSRHRQATLNLPTGTPVYQDTQEVRGKVLVSKRLRLKGRPDLLLEQQGQLIPVEVKTGKTPPQPYPGHVMQLIAYCVLVEAHYGQRPTHGIIRYAEQQFTVEFTREIEAELEALLALMHASRYEAQVHRNHRSPSRCKGCGFQRQCDEFLPGQQALGLEFE